MLERFRFSSKSPGDLPALRNRLIDILALIFVITFPISFIVNMPIFLKHRQYLPTIINIAMWIILLIRTLVPSLGYRIRNIIWLIMVYGMTISFLIILGPAYARIAWLILCLTMAAIFFGTRSALAATAFNALLLMTLYLTLGDYNATWAAAHRDGLENWIMFVINLTLISLCIGIPSGYLIGTLEKSLENEKHTEEEQEATLEELEAAMEELQATNEEYEAQNEILVRSEEELIIKETFIRRIIENAPAVIFRISLDTGQLDYVSPGSVDLTGYSIEETGDGKDLFRKLVPDEWRWALKSNWNDLVNGKGGEIIRFPIIHKSGELRWIEQRNVVVRDAGGTPVCMEGFCTDITAQMKMEEALRLSEEKYRTLVENINEVIYSVDSSGTITYISNAITRLAGYLPEELTGKSLISYIHPEDREKVTERFREIANMVLTPLEYRIVTKSGSPHWVMTFSKPIITDGVFHGINGVLTDINDRKEAEAEREEIQNQLIQAQKMEAIGTLAGGLAHDFNNMLGGIMGSLDLVALLLKKEEIGQRDTITNYIETALDSSRRAADLTRRLLTLSRKKELRLSPVDVNKSLVNVLKICKGSFPKSVKLDFQTTGGELLINADPTQIEQVLINLCLNASHAMTTMRAEGGKQGGTLRADAGIIQCDHELCALHPEADPDTPYVRIRISDTGVGMDQETKKRIFEPFFTTKQKDAGTGLGLAMAYAIVRQHQGFISVYSEPGNGSIFSLFIPLMREAAGAAAVDTNNGIVHGRGRILVVDDEEAILRVAAGMLRQCGYEVLTAKNAVLGIDAYLREHRQIDAVILDLSMPGMSGLETFDRMKQINPGIKVLLTSGHMEDEHLARSLETGIRGFVQKPYTATELSQKIKEILE